MDGGPVLKVDGGFVVCVDGCTLTVGKVDKLGDGVVCSTHIIVGSALGCALRRLGSALGCALMVGTTLTLGMVVGGAELAILGAKLTLG